MDYDHSFVAAMESKRDGGNNHAVCKALNYYRLALRKGGPANEAWVEILMRECRACMASGDYRPLTLFLADLW